MKKRLALLFAAFLAVFSLAACGPGELPELQLVYSGNPSSLVKTDQSIGSGAEAVSGKYARVSYSGWLYNDKATDFKGTQFDSGTFSYKVGSSGVIPGFDQGVTGMKVGGKRTVLIPSSLGYGSAGNPPSIPPNAGLVFEIMLLEVCDTQDACKD